MSYGLCAYTTAPYAGECLEISEDPPPVVDDNIEEYCRNQCTGVSI